MVILAFVKFLETKTYKFWDVWIVKNIHSNTSISMSSKKASLQRLASIVIITPDNINCGRLSNHNNISSQVGHLQSWESNMKIKFQIISWSKFESKLFCQFQSWNEFRDLNSMKFGFWYSILKIENRKQPNQFCYFLRVEEILC